MLVEPPFPSIPIELIQSAHPGGTQTPRVSTSGSTTSSVSSSSHSHGGHSSPISQGGHAQAPSSTVSVSFISIHSQSVGHASSVAHSISSGKQAKAKTSQSSSQPSPSPPSPGASSSPSTGSSSLPSPPSSSGSVVFSSPSTSTSPGSVVDPPEPPDLHIISEGWQLKLSPQTSPSTHSTG